MFYKISKRGFTLVELMIVITIMMILMTGFKSEALPGMIKNIEKQNIKDWIVGLNTEIKSYAFNNITIGQELLKDNFSTNKEVSRFNGVNDGTNSDTKLASYSAIYFTTKENDSIYNPGDVDGNQFFYFLQYRQEGFSNVNKRILENFDINHNTSIQLLKNINNDKWSDVKKIPTFRSYYLNKIVSPDLISSSPQSLEKQCTNRGSQMNYGYILYSTNDLTYKFYKKDVEESGFDYIFCFSRNATQYEEDSGAALRINRSTLNEYYIENLNNY